MYFSFFFTHAGARIFNYSSISNFSKRTNTLSSEILTGHQSHLHANASTKRFPRVQSPCFDYFKSFIYSTRCTFLMRIAASREMLRYFSRQWYTVSVESEYRESLNYGFICSIYSTHLCSSAINLLSLRRRILALTLTR